MKCVVLVKDIGYLKSGTRFVYKRKLFYPATRLTVKTNVSFPIEFIDENPQCFVRIK